MKVIISAAVLASAVSPAASFSYLESLNGANPVMSAAPAESNGSSYVEALAAPGSNAPTGAGIPSYVDNVPQNPTVGGGAGLATYLNTMSQISPHTDVSVSTAPAASASFAAAPNGTGMQSYLDAVPQNPAVSGPGMSSYLDSAPQNPAVRGAGMTSYLDTMATHAAPAVEGYTPAAAATPAVSAQAVTASAPSGSGIPSYLDYVPSNPAVGGAGMASYLDSIPQNPAVSGAGMTSYLDTTSGAAPASDPYTPSEPAAAAYSPQLASPPFTVSAPSGSGIASYLDTVPTNAAVGGPGMTSYLDSVPTNAVVGSGSGMNSYTENLDGGSAAASPFGSTAGSGSKISFTLEAESLAELIGQLQGKGGTIILTGSLDSISFN